MTPLEHLRVWLRQRENEVRSKVVLGSGEDAFRAVLTIGDLRDIETLASANGGDSKAARLERENEALLEDSRFHKSQMAEAVAKSEALALQLHRANDELIKERARADAFFDALTMLAGVWK